MTTLAPPGQFFGVMGIVVAAVCIGCGEDTQPLFVTQEMAGPVAVSLVHFGPDMQPPLTLVFAPPPGAKLVGSGHSIARRLTRHKLYQEEHFVVVNRSSLETSTTNALRADSIWYLVDTSENVISVDGKAFKIGMGDLLIVRIGNHRRVVQQYRNSSSIADLGRSMLTPAQQRAVREAMKRNERTASQ